HPAPRRDADGVPAQGEAPEPGRCLHAGAAERHPAYAAEPIQRRAGRQHRTAEARRGRHAPAARATGAGRGAVPHDREDAVACIASRLAAEALLRGASAALYYGHQRGPSDQATRTLQKVVRAWSPHPALAPALAPAVPLLDKRMTESI